MKTLILSTILISLIISCNKTEQTLIGEYESETIKFHELPLFYLSGFKGYTKGAKLLLQADSSFEYTTCANVFNGSWSEFNDSLFLSVTENRYRIDSLNVVGLEGRFATIPSKAITFKIEENLLISTAVNPKGNKFMSKLRKSKR